MLQKLEEGTQRFAGELRSTVVLTGSTSAGKTTSISAMLCCAEKPLGMGLLPTDEYENTNSVTELYLHPISGEPPPPSIKRIWWDYTEGAEPSPASPVGPISFDGYQPLSELLTRWQDESRQGGRMEVDTREIHLHQSCLEVEMLIVDTPGLGGTNNKVRQALERIVEKRLFLCVVVINCTSPTPIGGEVLTTLRKLAEIGHKHGTYVPPIFVFTHWDRVTNKEGLKRTLERLALDLRGIPDDGGPAVLSEGLPCFFASINGREALSRFEAGRTECAAVREVTFLLEFLSMYGGGLEGMLRSLRHLSETQEAVQRMTDILFEDNENTKLFSKLSEAELKEKGGRIKKEFKDKLSDKLKTFPSNAAALRNVVAALGTRGRTESASLPNLLENASEHGPKEVRKKLRSSGGRVCKVKYQTELCKFFSHKFAGEWVDEIAILQKEVMDQLTAQIEDMVDTEKLIPNAMDHVKMMSGVYKGVSAGLGFGVGATVFSSSYGVMAGLGALSATGVGLTVALSLMGLAGLWGWNNTTVLLDEVDKEANVDKVLDFFLGSFTKKIPDFKRDLTDAFDKQVDAFLNRLTTYRSQIESPELANIMCESTATTKSLNQELMAVLKKLSRMDQWICGNAELEKIVKETRLVNQAPNVPRAALHPPERTAAATEGAGRAAASWMVATVAASATAAGRVAW